jgi:hypothetical protein
MGSLLGELIDRIIQLLNLRKTRKRDAFDQFIEPAYRKAGTVIPDLLGFYQDVLNTVTPYGTWHAGEEQEFVNSIIGKRSTIQTSGRASLATGDARRVDGAL